MAEKISLKKPIRYEKDAIVQSAFNDIYKHINELVDSVNSVGTDAHSEGGGKEGDMRVTQKSDQNVSLEVRVEDGWYESQLFDTDPEITTSTITDLTVTQTTGAVTANGSVTIDNGASPTNDEIYELAIETNAKIIILNSKLKEVIGIINDMNVSGFKILDKRHQ